MKLPRTGVGQWKLAEAESIKVAQLDRALPHSPAHKPAKPDHAPIRQPHHKPRDRREDVGALVAFYPQADAPGGAVGGLAVGWFYGHFRAASIIATTSRARR